MRRAMPHEANDFAIAMPLLRGVARDRRPENRSHSPGARCNPLRPEIRDGRSLASNPHDRYRAARHTSGPPRSRTAGGSARSRLSLTGSRQGFSKARYYRGGKPVANTAPPDSSGCTRRHQWATASINWRISSRVFSSRKEKFKEESGVTDHSPDLPY